MQLLGEREYRSADLYIPEIDKLIEVKSGYGCASFRNGAQISDKKFDFCVFYPVIDGWVDDAYIFSVEELTGLPPRPEYAKHSTNEYLLLFFIYYRKGVVMND
ncbi:hypothetical protein ACFL0D_00115 [Thermoproteota archaeon]